ncbi:RRM domain-containing protein [Plasmodiophora brassicae]
MTAAPEYEEVVDAGQIRRRCAGADDGGVRVEPPPDQAHLSRVVRLRGLPFPVTQDDVRAFFGRVGVESMVVCRNECGLSTGEAYVRVASLTDVGVALSMHLGPIRGRYIEVFLSDNNKFHAAVEFNDAVDKARRMRTSTSFHASCTQNQTRAYIRMRGLPYDCTDADVTRFFRPVHAAPTRIAWCSEKRCECIVELGPDVDACRAMTCNGNYIGKRYVELAPSSIAGFIEAARYATANAAPTKGKPRIRHEPGPGCVVRMRGLPYGCTEAEIVEFFGACNVATGSVRIEEDSCGRVTGTAWASFHTPADAKRAVALRNKRYIGCRYIDLDSVDDRLRAARESRPESRFASSVILKGLSHCVTENDIDRFFRGYRIAPGSVEVRRDTSGMPIGVAFVRFVNVAEAARAVADLNGGSIGDRYITLSMR